MTETRVKMQVSKVQVQKSKAGINKYGKHKYKSAGEEKVNIEKGIAILTQIRQKRRAEFSKQFSATS